MIAVQTPWVLWLSGVAALGVVLAHLLSVGRPPELALPTTRFVPNGPLDAVSRARTLRDLALLCLRVLAVLLAGAAFAGFSMAPSRAPLATLLALDLPRFASDTMAWRDSARATLDARAPVLGVVTSDGRSVRGDAAALRTFVDTMALLASDPNGSSLAGALLVARREAATVAARADSMSLVVISPFREDAAIPALRAARATWPGRVELTAVPSAPVGDTAAPSTVRRAFGVLLAADSAFARDGGVLMVWPDSAIANSAATADSGFAVVARGLAMVTPMRRVPHVPANATPNAWWPDGTVAIGETPLGAGCVRWIGFDAPTGDALLTGSARGVRAALDAPCGASAPPLLSDSLRTLVMGSGAIASRTLLVGDADPNASTLARWLLLGAIGALLIEQAMRSRVPRRAA